MILTLTRTSAKADSTEETVNVVPVWDGANYTYADLPKYDGEGYAYTYDVNETQVEGYGEPEKDDSAENEFHFTNRLVGTVTITGSKTWIDGNKEHDNSADVPLVLSRISAKADSTEETVEIEPDWNDAN